MQSMIDKNWDFETACAAAVKAKNFSEAAKAAAGAADCIGTMCGRISMGKAGRAC